jgi:hypothetical protein
MKTIHIKNNDEESTAKKGQILALSGKVCFQDSKRRAGFSMFVNDQTNPHANTILLTIVCFVYSNYLLVLCTH